jgi:hypothetical protein
MVEQLISKFALTLLLVQMLFLSGAAALADIDPASDVLLQEDVFYPYDPKVCPQLQDQLNKLTADAKDAGYPIKAALIETSSDLGGASALFDPDRYAPFLYKEIGNQIDGPVLIAMPGGFGMAPRPPEARVLRDLEIPDDADSDELARATLRAIPKLAEAAGKDVKQSKISSACSKEGGSGAMIVLVPVALLALTAAAIALGRRRPGGDEV